MLLMEMRKAMMQQASDNRRKKDANHLAHKGRFLDIIKKKSRSKPE
jgi:hypothetical protein